MSRALRLVAVAMVCVVLATTLTVAKSAAERRQKIDAMASDALGVLFEKNPKAERLFSAAHGYAVFDNLKLSLVISGGGGSGVAVDKSSGERVYMRMGTAGLNVGLGGQKYQIVFIFQDSETFRDFVENGWQADAQANAVAGKSGANAATTFENGMAVFQLTEAGLMLQADISGTKYWKSKKLN